MQPSIRKIKDQDLPEIKALMADFAAYENLSDYCDVTVERLRSAMFGENSYVEGLVAIDGNSLIGYALYYPCFSSFRGQRGLYLEDIYVKPERQGGGIGETLLKHIAREAASRGFERIDFQVLDWNRPAIEFYKKHGAVSNDEETHFKFADDAFYTLSS